MDVFVVGRYPPPLDGQSMATRRLAELLEATHAVHRVNTEPPATAYVAAETRFRPARLRHYLKLRRPLREALRAAPEAPVLWTSVSPVPLGHWRDVLTVLPAFGPRQRVYAVVHRATLHATFRSSLTALTARRMARRVNGFVFLSEELAERCAPWIPSARRFVIPNTIDDAVSCTAAELDARMSRPVGRPLQLLFLSNMMPEKGYLDVVLAAALLRDRGLPVHAHFAGGWVTDEDRTAFESVVASHHLHEVVTHHGSLTDRGQIKALYLQADVFVLPTYHPTEAQPVSIIEALNAGTPVVTTRHGGLPEMVREGEDALFVPPRTPEAIAAAVEHLSDDATWRGFSQRARRRFETRFGPDAVRRRWEALIRGDLEGGGR